MTKWLAATYLLPLYAPLSIIFALATASPTHAQINFTANDTVPLYTKPFGFGANMGYYTGWTDDQLADIAVGNSELNITGTGVNVLRPSLPENFVEEWGYDIRTSTFEHYGELGATENTVFIGYPSQRHRDKIYYCDNVPSEMFDNLYRDIWDDGADGTPINDDNWYAAYVYRLVNKYKKNVRFWEVWNEPDYSFVYEAELPPGQPGNWWENNPDPCDYALRAPVFHYIRTLRISYEVIKYIDPDAYVAVGGLGFPSFLDAIMRNTDNPDDGAVDSLRYPLRGGAYFDVLSYHTYPHIDGSLREWSNEISNFKYKRHSDESVAGVLDRKHRFEEVLNTYGYNGERYPEKVWIITEANIPRRSFNTEFIGSEIAQRNFVIKTVVKVQDEDIRQVYFYSLGDLGTEDSATDEFQLMGLYRNLSQHEPYDMSKTQAGVGLKTAYDELHDKTYDPQQTKRLNLPNHIDGGAFVDSNGQYTYVLWAKTTEDNSELARTTYEFSSRTPVDYLKVKSWDHSRTQLPNIIHPKLLELTGDPVFISSTDERPNASATNLLNISPNPFSNFIHVDFYLENDGMVQLELIDVAGRIVDFVNRGLILPKGSHRIQLRPTNLANGTYFIRFQTGNRVTMRKLILMQ